MSNPHIEEAREDLNDARAAYNAAQKRSRAADLEYKAAAEAVALAKILVDKAREALEQVTTDQYAALPIEPSPWSVEQLRDALLSAESDLIIALRQHRTLLDVQKTRDALITALKGPDKEFASLLGLSKAEVWRLTNIRDDTRVFPHVCSECFSWPHQATCSQSVEENDNDANG